MSNNESKVSSIYMIRCNGTRLYAFTRDRAGRSLPSHIYPRICWRLERSVTLRRHQNPAEKRIRTAILDAIKRRGFY
jgi:hypothetical protein